MSERIQIDFDQMHHHLSRVGTVSEGVHLAADATQGINVGDGAFGVLCSFLAFPTELASAAAQEVINEAGQLIDRAGEELAAAREDFASLEQDLSTQIRSMGSGLP